ERRKQIRSRRTGIQRPTNCAHASHNSPTNFLNYCKVWCSEDSRRDAMQAQQNLSVMTQSEVHSKRGRAKNLQRDSMSLGWRPAGDPAKNKKGGLCGRLGYVQKETRTDRASQC